MSASDNEYSVDACKYFLEQFVEQAGYTGTFDDQPGYTVFFEESDIEEIATKAPPMLEKWFQKLNEVDVFTEKEARDYTMELLKLSLYDIHVLVDNSGSMTRGNRTAVLKEQLAATIRLDNAFLDEADEATGVRIHLLHGEKKRDIVKNNTQLTKLWDRIKFKYGTPLGTVLRNKVWGPILNKNERMKKPSLVYILTDGEPTDEDDDAFCESIVECKDRLAAKRYPPTAIVFGIVQIGGDKDAADFLAGLARDPRLRDSHGNVRHIDVSEAAKEFSDAVKLSGNEKAMTIRALMLRNLIGAIEATVPDRNDDDGDGNGSD